MESIRTNDLSSTTVVALCILRGPRKLLRVFSNKLTGRQISERDPRERRAFSDSNVSLELNDDRFVLLRVPSQFRRLPTALYAPPDAPSCYLSTTLLLPFAPSILPLKRPSFLSKSEKKILDPKFGVYNINVYDHPGDPAPVRIRIPIRRLPGIANLIHQRRFSNALRLNGGGH